MTHPIRWTKWRDVGTMYSWNNWTGNSKYHVYFWIKFSIWETAHLPLPLPNINPNLLLVDCRWVKGGVGTQLLGCGHWSRFPYPPRPHNPPPPKKKCSETSDDCKLKSTKSELLEEIVVPWQFSFSWFHYLCLANVVSIQNYLEQHFMAGSQE